MPPLQMAPFIQWKTRSSGVRTAPIIPVKYTSTPIWEDGNLAGAVVTFQDVTERKQAELTLRSTEKMYRQILDSISDMIFMKDSEFQNFMGEQGLSILLQHDK